VLPSSWLHAWAEPIDVAAAVVRELLRLLRDLGCFLPARRRKFVPPRPETNANPIAPGHHVLAELPDVVGAGERDLARAILDLLNLVLARAREILPPRLQAGEHPSFADGNARTEPAGVLQACGVRVRRPR